MTDRVSPFGQWLDQQIANRGLPGARALARELGVHENVVYKWMSGTQPTTESCERIAERLGLDLRDVLIAAGHLRPETSGIDLSKVDYRAAIWAQHPHRTAKRMIEVLNTILEIDREFEDNSKS